MKLKLEKNKKYTVPQKRMKAVEKMYQAELAERKRIAEMTDEEYDAYMLEEVKQMEKEIEEDDEFYTHEEVMEIIMKEIAKDNREKGNYEKWMRLTKKMRVHAI